jgi:hypothetical protein
MPPINREKITEYVILSITDGKIKMLDLTTLANKRNYKHKLVNELKAQVEKRSPVYNEFKNANVNAIEVEVLDAINGTYLDAINYMNKIATKYNYKTPKAINSTILDIQLELQATKKEPKRLSEPQTQLQEPTPTPTEEVDEEEVEVEEVEVEEVVVVKAEVKKPKKAVQKIKLKQVEDEIKEAINTPITATKPIITIDYEEDEELEPQKPKINKLTKKQEQQKNKLIQSNTQTITDYYTLKKEKECLEAKMNTLHLAILTNYTTLANTFQYTDESINNFNFE